MFRDKIKTASYFHQYIREQQKRIARFSDKLQELTSSSQSSKIQQCHNYLVGFYQDLIYAQYSAGLDKNNLRELFKKYLFHVNGKGTLTSDSAIHVLSWSILFDVDCSDLFSSIEYPQDGLIDSLLHYVREGNITPINDNSLLFPQQTSFFAKCLNGQVSAEELSEYVDVFWYHDNKDSSWFDSDKRNSDTYCGYWCFLGAAIAKIKKFSPASFAEIDFFPLDLL